MWSHLESCAACPWCGGTELRRTAASGRQQWQCGRCSGVTDVERGVWRAMGPYRPQRSLAQLANSVPPEPQLYERLWRAGAAARFSGGAVNLRSELDELVSSVVPHRQQLVVDVGCSEALYGRTLASSGSNVVAVDHSLSFLRRADRRCRRSSLPVAAVQALAQHLPLRSQSADAVVIGGSLNEIGDRTRALAEMRRVLRDGGTCFSTSLVGAAGALGRRLQRGLTLTGIDFPSLDGTVAEFEAASLAVRHVRCDGILARITATAH